MDDLRRLPDDLWQALRLPPSDLLDRCDFGRHVEHGDAEGAARAIVEIAATAPPVREAMGRRARQLIDNELSKATLCGRMAELVENMLLGRPGRGSLLPMAHDAAEAPSKRKAA